jgi:hypothetical protein
MPSCRHFICSGCPPGNVFLVTTVGVSAVMDEAVSAAVQLDVGRSAGECRGLAAAILSTPRDRSGVHELTIASGGHNVPSEEDDRWRILSLPSSTPGRLTA